jgi:hypothetical protein
MYSKREINCSLVAIVFLMLAAGSRWGISPAVDGASHRSSVLRADGGHPPPGPWKTAELFVADGGHPPPPLPPVAPFAAV